jgi:hypothetical protein
MDVDSDVIDILRAYKPISIGLRDLDLPVRVLAGRSGQPIFVPRILILDVWRPFRGSLVLRLVLLPSACCPASGGAIFVNFSETRAEPLPLGIGRKARPT